MPLGIPKISGTRLGRRELLGMGLGAALLGTRSARAGTGGDAAWLARMDELHVPGMSVARIEGGKVSSVRCYGFARRERPRPVTPATRFQAASVSKPVTVLAALRLVAERRLELDAPVIPLLRSWRPSGADGAWDKVTLRRLMSHSAGLSVSGFPGYDAQAPLPSLSQILDGLSPANTPPVRPEFPADVWRYSGGGTTIMQMLLADVTGEPFPRLMRRLVLDPLGMRESGFEQPVRNDANCAFGYDEEGKEIAGHWHVYPELAAAGLWSTPRDLAKFVIALLPSRAPAELQAAAAMMREAQPGLDAGGGPFGLGLFLTRPDTPEAYFHTGSNEGFRCMFAGFPGRGDGAVVMTNGSKGGILADEMVTALTGLII